MKVHRRVASSSGIFWDDDEHFDYPKAEVQQTDRSGHWPGMGFTLKSGSWPDHKPEPEPGYVFLYMYGADISLFSSGDFIVRGFVNEDKLDSPIWRLEQWHCGR